MLLVGLLDGMSIDGVPFLETGSHGLKFKTSGGVVGGKGGSPPPPFANARHCLRQVRTAYKGTGRMMGFLENLEGNKCALTARCPFKQTDCS